MTEAGFRLPGRVMRSERMDEEPLDEADLARCLRDLDRLTRASLGYRPTFTWLQKSLAGRKRVSILDVGCGSGDMLRRIHTWAQARGIAATLTGLDVNPATISIAREITPPDMDVQYEGRDLFDLPDGQRFDIVISSLFAHHLSDANLVRFVRWMESRATLGWMISDLHRHPVAHAGLAVLLAAAPLHPVVKHDGPVSVQRAFTHRDLRDICAAADLGEDAATLTWHVPFRWRLARLKPAT